MRNLESVSNQDSLQNAKRKKDRQLKNFKFDGITLLSPSEAYLGENFHYEDGIHYYSHGVGFMSFHWHFKKQNE
jgi:hypothetical protein